MRTAKLLCESGEYVCTVRDVSTGGVMIRLFHEVPPDTHLFLELASGDRYAMQRRWYRDDCAGYRFASSIDVNEFIEEPSAFRRRPLRIRLQRSALISAGGKDCRGRLVNVSQQGACVELGDKLSEGDECRLDVHGLPIRFGDVRWRNGHAHGLVFQQAFPLEHFARCVFAMQPFPAETPGAEDGDDAATALYA